MAKHAAAVGVREITTEIAIVSVGTLVHERSPRIEMLTSEGVRCGLRRALFGTGLDPLKGIGYNCLDGDVTISSRNGRRGKEGAARSGRAPGSSGWREGRWSAELTR